MRRWLADILMITVFAAFLWAFGRTLWEPLNYYHTLSVSGIIYVTTIYIKYLTEEDSYV